MKINDELMVIFNEIIELDNKYRNSVTNKKRILNDIKEKIVYLKNKTALFNNKLRELEMYYSYRDYYVNDYKVVLNLIQRLVNQNEEICASKKIIATDFVQINKQETQQLYGKTYVILNKNLINNFDEEKLYYHKEIANISRKILEEKNSIIIVSYNFFDGNVKPNLINLNGIERIEIKHGGMIGNISCYLYDDELKDAVIKIINYINENGPDFENIDEDVLYNSIVDYNKQFKMIKK